MATRPHSIFDRPVAFHRAFAEIEYEPGKRCGPLAALLLSQAVYWQRTGSTPRSVPSKLHGSGWWFHTEDRWQEETALSPKEQQTARSRLVAAGVLEVVRAGRPARLWYRVNLQALEALFTGTSQVRQKGGTKFRRSAELSSDDLPNTQETRRGGDSLEETRPLPAAEQLRAGAREGGDGGLPRGVGDHHWTDTRPPGVSARRQRREDLRAFGPAVKAFLEREKQNP